MLESATLRFSHNFSDTEFRIRDHIASSAAWSYVYPRLLADEI
jgi:hypothetical protein